jgi:site-specific DNA-methyltransferase (adenine-specific)
MSLPKPYYQDESCTIYHGDCREILPHLEPVDLVCMDPPYGISWKRGINSARSSKKNDGIQNDHDTSARDECLAIIGDRPAIVFGSFYAPFPLGVKQVLVWHKPADSGLYGSTTGFRRDAEPIFLCGFWPITTVKRSSVFKIQRGQSCTVSETGHPHTKPVGLIVQLLEFAPSYGTILDPFMGSGTTLRAAKDLGRKAIGIELEEKYCEVAAKRLRQEVFSF